MEAFEFDPDKSRLNKDRHGVDLEWAQGLWAVAHVIIPARDVIGESRFLILAEMAGRCFVAVFTRRGEAIRMISCHRADRRLERIYERQIRSQEDQ